MSIATIQLTANRPAKDCHPAANRFRHNHCLTTKKLARVARHYGAASQ
ncbi:hypothetical protein EDC56_2190 [Sinobacterium caligoides]|uniref:Uncharacterized protein n=1 Tax=Sinobacterium caligoides TaxID=933926 RepID=A0A3N2DR19_9GAMM|nr:hypothetical protein EDC56_2190 [Sinobacterium caligoides]